MEAQIVDRKATLCKVDEALDILGGKWKTIIFLHFLY
jgi:DNA-binding HxlR family transcriptional regulator